MRIETKQRVSIGLSLGIALLAGVTLFASLRRVDTVVQDNLANANIIELLANMSFLGVQYITHGEDRFRTQWLTQDARLRQLLQNDGYDTEIQATRNVIRLNHEAARYAFRQIADVRARFKAKPDGNQRALEELQDRLYGQLVAKSQDMTTDAFQLSRIGYERIIAAGRIANALTMIFVVLIIGIIIMNARLVSRSILGPLRKIQDGARHVGAGDFTHRIGIDNQNEIGELARAFDNMTLRLHDSRTEVIAAEASLRAHANLMDAVFDNMHDGVSVVGADLKIIRANAAARRFMGLQPGAALPAQWQDIQGRYYADRVTRIEPHNLALTRVLRGEAAHNNELYIVNSNFPQGLCLESSATRMEGAALVIWHDVTTVRQAQQVLRDTAVRFSAIVNSAMDCIITIDHEGRITEFNPAAERTFGHRREDVINKDLAEIIIPPPLRDAHRKGMAHYLQTGEGPVLGKRVELNALRADGSEFPIELGITVMRADGPPLFTAHLRDITERKRAEERFRLAVDAAPNAMIMMDKDGHITLANAETERMFGYPKTELIGLEVERLVPQRFRGAHPGHRSRFFADPQPRAMGAGRDLYGLRKDGTEIPIEIGLNPIRIAEDLFVLASIIDITARQQAAAEVERLNETLELRASQLEDANKELEAFCYSISHDLRAPLRAIDGFSRMVVEQFSATADPEALRYLARVRANAQQMGTLIDDLLAFSRLGRQPLTPRSVNTTELVRQCLDTLRVAESSGHVATAAVTLGELPFCQGDPGLLREVWMNLLSNALKFSAKRPLPRVEAGSQVTNDQTVYFVRDNGAGFDMRYADKLFGVFQRLHAVKDFPGTGVGLALVQRIVHRHGGRIWAEAQPDRGATFYFTLGETHAPV